MTQNSQKNKRALTDSYHQNQTSTGLKFGSLQNYTLLPARLADEFLQNNIPYWRIEIHDMMPMPAQGVDMIGKITIGRGDSADMRIDNNLGLMEGVSREHVRLSSTTENLLLTDLGSKNGTLVNGRILEKGEVITVKDGDKITMGNLTVRLQVIDHSTLGELRDFIFQQIEAEIIKRSVASQEDAEVVQDTIAMHFSNTVRYPSTISRWMSDRHSSESE